MTKFLLTCGQDLTVLDAVAEFVEIVCNLDKRIHGVVSLIEEWETSERFDNIVFAHVLEHVADPLGILRTLGRFLAPGGRLIIIVPNANSLHRLVGVKMGLISHMCELNDSDRRVGHRRVYTPSTLCADITAAGLSLVKWEGIFLKPLANGQLTADNWSPELVEAYYQLGFDYPELCGGSLPFAKLPTELPRSDSPN
jgi:2-polyprenyl-3-methyl-5-hydroxy-6-metoxy-1,4-benzoquinol methylase